MSVIFIVGIILIIAVLSCKTSDKIGLPVLVGFILIGMAIGRWFGFEDISDAEQICNFSLMLIIFTGGFQTNFAEAKPVLAMSTLLSTAGTVLTAGVTAAFGYYVLRLQFYEAILLGAVISSTDAASVFSILRSKNLNLKNNLDSVLQIESGSNDPIAYMLTVIFLSLATGNPQSAAALLAAQIIVGVAAGVVGAKLGQILVNKLELDIEGLYAALLMGVALAIYGAASRFGGNGFLAVYIGGMIMGNKPLVRKRLLAAFFSAFSMLAQINLFVVLGMLTKLSSVISVAASGLAFALFLFVIARPLVMLLLMKPFGRSLKEIALVSWAGFRGASSIVFAIYLFAAGLPYAEYVFCAVFFVCMLSVIVQGSLIAPLARSLDLITSKPMSLKTFTEFTTEIQDKLLEVKTPPGSAVCGKTIHELDLPNDFHIIAIKRDEKLIAPIQSVVILEGDTVILAGNSEEKLLKLRKVIGG